ncbi:alpha/beta fold hydrolase [Pseudonocardia sp. GCM10023141]|uniref:alpha/beta fold hydrolase n=1 Tax=Pseudonocardia sp. GCM10023141 TaxID=3252653 RepID=UPI0036125F7F
MTVVLVHGNPETDAIWRPLVAELGRDDVVCLSPPGFGAPLPAGFDATVTGYRDWLVGELTAIGEPVHLIGHDWGGGHVMNVAMSRPDLLLSWTTDVIGIYEPDYVWHDLAQMWLKPGAGEKLVEMMFGASLAERAERCVGLGMPQDIAEAVAAGQNDEMGRALLVLYRSAPQPVLAALGEHLPAAAIRPGLCLLATEDHFGGSDETRRRGAARAGARVEVLEGLGHWWMLQDPARGAKAVGEFLASV